MTRAAAQVSLADRSYWPTAGWQTAAPEEQGVDSALLTQASGCVQTELPLLLALVVVHGDIAFEEYPNTFLNDVAVSPTGDAHLSNSFNPILFRVLAAAIPARPGTPGPAPTTDSLEVSVDFTMTGFNLVQPGSMPTAS